MLAICGQNVAGAPTNAPETAPAEGKIIHVPAVSVPADAELSVQARVDGASERVVFMRLYYKTETQDSYNYVEMLRSGAGFIGTLPAERFAPPRLEYFITAMLADRTIITHPDKNPYGNPHRVEVTGATGAGSQPAEEPAFPDLTPPLQQAPASLPATEEAPTDTTAADDEAPWLILSPEPEEVYGKDEEVMVAISFTSDFANPLDAESVHLFLDATDVTADADVSEYLFTYTTQPLAPGRHTLLANGLYKSGLELPTLSWSFVVAGEKQKSTRTVPLARGRIFAESRQENISGIAFTDNNVGGSVFGQYGAIKYDARAYFTTREDSRFQPRNRFSFNLQLPVLGVTLGDTYPRFNDLILWGKRVRGIHARLHTGFFNVDVVHGETTRRVSALSAIAVDTTTGDTLQNVAGLDSTFISEFGTHRQKLLGVRTSFGGGRHFQLGFNLLKVRDDTTSLAAGEFSTFPQDNLVVGSDFLLAFARRRIEFRAAAAFSLISNDISTGPLSKAEIEDQFDVDLPFDPADFDKYLIINSSTTPLDPRDLTSLAYNFSLRLNFFQNNLQFGYKSIGSEYVSLGNSFLRNNLRGFYLNDRIRLFRNKLYVNLGFEDYDDNFSPDDENNPTKLRTISTGFSIFPGQGYPNLTVNLRNHNRDNDIDSLVIDLTNGFPDTTDNRENNSTQDLTVQMSYDTQLLNLNHTISLTYIASDRNDVFNASRLPGVPSTETSSNVQVFSVRTRYRIPLTTTLNFARNDNKFSAGLNTFNFKMFGLRAEYRLLKERLNTYAGLNYTTASGVASTDTTTGAITSLTDYKRTTFNVGSRYEFTPGHFLLFDASLISFKDNGATLNSATGVLDPNPSFTDRVFRLYYEKRF